jgi:phosphoglycerate dehydrogenase-like enzyme
MSGSQLRRVAILDDYQEVSQKCADWGVLKDRVTIDTYTDTIRDEDALVDRLKPYEIICAMRERTPFTKSLLDRLPNLKYVAALFTSGWSFIVSQVYSDDRTIQPWH